MASQRSPNPRREFVAPKPLPVDRKRRFSETDLDTQSGTGVKYIKRISNGPECTESDMMQDEKEVEEKKEEKKEEKLEEEEKVEVEEEKQQDDLFDEKLEVEEKMEVEEEKQGDDLLDALLGEMTEMFEFEFDTQPSPKPPPKVKKTVSWAKKLAVVMGDSGGDDVGDGTDCESEEE